MKLSDFTYNLPEELIAQHPTEKRDESRLMVLDKCSGNIEHKKFKDIMEYINPGDCLVINNTKVIPARLLGYKKSVGAGVPDNPHSHTGAKVEILLLKNLGQDKWEAMVRPGKKLLSGARVSFGDGILEAEVLEKCDDGNRIVQFKYKGVFNEILDKVGLMPLPPYIKEKLEDRDRYQTVYAEDPGSAAAPTAGLHFTEELLDELRKKGVNIANVTLNVGIGTFRPVKVENIEEHHMHSEYFKIDKENADIINDTKASGGRVIAVGTTSCRVLESATDESGVIHPMEKDTSIFIYGDYRFKMIDALITNFHLPESTLLMLISAFAGRENVLNAYETAVKEKYRFFSFGDAMYITSLRQTSSDTSL